MPVIDFKKKLNFHRQFGASAAESAEEFLVNQAFESDRGRIINSAAVRRLQQKTQVFPLEQNSAVRSRLTHSLEVQQVGRYIAKTILSQLKQSQQLEEYGLDERTDAFESVVEMACLMHDIGNPPFGHFGEAAIQKWFGSLLGEPQTGGEDNCQIAALRLTGSPQADNLRRQLRRDLCQFEGNAQGMRMAHHLLKLNLTFAQIGSVLKYTRPAWQLEPVPEEFDYLTKKPGYYWSENTLIQRLRDELQLGEFCRFPLSYIMEAADDISYCIADLDDAVEKGILTPDTLVTYLRQEWRALEGSEDSALFRDTVELAYQSLTRSHHRSPQDQFFMYLRVYITNKLVPYTAQRFIDNLPAVFAGTYNQALLEDKSEEHRLLKTLKRVAFKYVFTHHEVEELELQGFRIINGLLDFYRPLLMMPQADFADLVRENFHKYYFIETRLLHKLSRKQRAAYSEAVAALAEHPPEERTILEFYYRARLIQDYISGMTDHYAYEEYRRFSVCQ